MLLVTAPIQERPRQQLAPAGHQPHSGDRPQPGLLQLMLDLMSLAGGRTGSSSRLQSLPGLVECGVHASWQRDMEVLARTKGEAGCGAVALWHFRPCNLLRCGLLRCGAVGPVGLWHFRPYNLLRCGLLRCGAVRLWDCGTVGPVGPVPLVAM